MSVKAAGRMAGVPHGVSSPVVSDEPLDSFTRVNRWLLGRNKSVLLTDLHWH
jgi:hypothetical protein